MIKGFKYKVIAGWFRFESNIVRFIYNFIKYRPASGEFLSGDSYRKMASHYWDSDAECTIRPDKVQEGDILFVSSWVVRKFLIETQHQIKNNFLIVTSNGDINVDFELASLQGPLCKHWFAQNLVVDSPRLSALPIGLENRCLHWHGVPSDFRQLRRQQVVKKARIIYGFSIANNVQERSKANAVLQKIELADEVSGLNSRLYRQVMQSYMFVVSPPGNGEDCHRTWEALYLRVVPIVKRSVLTESFFKLGIPVWIIDDWEELLDVNQEELESRYKEALPGFNATALYASYWKERILAAQLSIVHGVYKD